MASSLSSAYQQFVSSYSKSATPRIKLIDAFLALNVALGVLQFVYMLVAGRFPFNAFVSGFFASVGTFVLTVSLRLQLTNPKDFDGRTPERALSEYVFCVLVLFLAVINFMG